jgi:hypothetical protein
LINPRQICQAIAPLAETLFPTPRIPVFRTHLNEGWIVFEESSILDVKPLKLAKRTTLASYWNSGKGLNVNIPPEREGALPSAPLRQTSSGELVANLPDRRDPPSSARIEVKKGTKSFLRPFLLGGRKKKGEMPAAAMHKSRREEGSEVHAIGKMVDEHLQVELDTPESPYEERALIDRDGSEASPVWAPLAGKKGVSKRVAEMRVDESVPASPGVMTPTTAKVPLTPITPNTPVSPSIVNSSIPSPVPTPTTAVIQLSPIEVEVPLTPISIKPITPSLATTTPPSPIISTPSSRKPTTPTGIIKPPTHKKRGHERDHDHHRHHHRNPDETSDERRKRKDREHARREDRSEERGSRSSEIEKVEKEATWLEVVFEDLPFGPDKNMVSALLLFPSRSFSFYLRPPSKCNPVVLD